jgi:hypothetical protein
MLGPPPVSPAVWAVLGYLSVGHALAVEPPDAVALLGVELRCDLRRYKRRYLLEGVSLVGVIADAAADEVLAPVALPLG